MSILDNTPLPFDLLKEVDLKNEMKWDDIQAKIWESENYREKYLNINFSGIESEENISFNLKFNDQELIEERLIHKNTHNNISILNENLNSTNSINDSLVKQKSEFSTKSHGINNQNKKNKEDDKSSSSIYKIGCLMFIFIFIVINLFTFLTKSCVDAILH